MKSRFNYTDLIFGIALIITLLFLGIFLFSLPYSHDETFYLTVPFRLVNGDSLVKNEWHLTQFSSLFSYIPTLLWLEIKGSTEGILIFSRCVYLLIQTALTVTIYSFFRKYKIWAVVSAILFLTQFINIMQQISYHSMFVCCLLLLALSIISIYNKKTGISYIFAGVCYALCCICNPIFCFAIILYLAFCIMWKNRKSLSEAFFKLTETAENHIKHKYTAPSNKTHKKKKRKKAKPEKTNSFLQNTENYDCFFSSKAVCYSFIGIGIVAILAIAFFFGTGGTISSVFDNIKNLFASSEYQTNNLSYKIIYAYNDFNDLVSNKAFLLPVLFAVLFLDKKRTENSHRCIYIIISFLISALYFIGIFNKVTDDIYFFEFSFFIFSTVSYIVTKKKNKSLFFCMWLPCTTATVFHLLASASLLSAMNVVLVTSNIAGVFFLADLFKEISDELKLSNSNKGISFKVSQYIFCVALCLQILSHLSFFQIALYTPNSTVKADSGPYCGVLMTEHQASDYEKSIVDLNLIKNYIPSDSPVYIAAWQNWMYLHLERPIGAHTSYYYGAPDPVMLNTYYQQNPDHIPEYIYLPANDYFNNTYYDYSLDDNMRILSEMFNFNVEKLDNGILLKVTQYSPKSENELE